MDTIPSTTPMFGLIVAGRMVQSNFTVPSPGKFLVQVPQPDSLNHIVVFLTGVEAFPPGYGGQIYFSVPENTMTDPPWHHLGFISNEKPSAIFKVGGLKEKPGTSHQPVPQQFGSPIFGSAVAQLGISIETLECIQQSTPTPSAAPSTNPTYIEFVRRMLDNFYNYVTSFGSDGSNISLDLVRRWYENVERRLLEDPGWWRR